LNSPQQIFNLDQELPAPQTDEDVQLLAMVEQLAGKIQMILRAGHKFPESELHVIFDLRDAVIKNPHAGMIYGSILMMLGEANAQNDVMDAMIGLHGSLPPFYLSKALALANLGRLEEALDNILVIIGAGMRHFEIYMQAARWKYLLKDYRGAISMANLAVFENISESVEPFVLMAQCFSQCGELNRMFECFSRIEKLQGESALAREFGELYRQHQGMYGQIKGMMKA
jgi:tetratricopeptide (TPR) repeat protein